MPVYTAYVGTYTAPMAHVNGHAAGVYAISVDSDTGGLAYKFKDAIDAGLNPSYVRVGKDPVGDKYLFAVNEGSAPPNSIRSLKILDNGTAEQMDFYESPKMWAPCYISTTVVNSLVFLMVANYMSRNVNVFKVEEGGKMIEMDFAQFEGASLANPQRQEASHAHSIVPAPNGSLVLVADLGADVVRVLALGPEGKLDPKTRNDSKVVKMPPGSGPRHLVFHPTKPWVYVSLELSNQVAFLTISNSTKNFEIELSQVLSTLPEGFKGTNHVAEIKLSANGDHLYVSNRGHDSIAHFAIDQDTGFMKGCCKVVTQAQTPRGFDLTPDGRFLVVAGQDNDLVVTLEVDAVTGCPSITNNTLTVPSPVCIAFE